MRNGREDKCKRARGGVDTRPDKFRRREVLVAASLKKIPRTPRKGDKERILRTRDDGCKSCDCPGISLRKRFCDVYDTNPTRRRNNVAGIATVFGFSKNTFAAKFREK
ncbi:unnamed protein product, partial [Iphiclides podalirius]